MSLLIYYLIFAIATAIVGVLVVYYPVVQEVKLESINASVVVNPIQAYLTIFALMFILAPLIFSILLSTNKTQLFKNGLKETFLE